MIWLVAQAWFWTLVGFAFGAATAYLLALMFVPLERDVATGQEGDS